VASPPTTRGRFWAVTLSTAGVFTAISLSSLAHGVTAHNHTTFGLLRLLAMETVMAAFWVHKLRREGWRLSSVTLPFAAGDVLFGIGLWILALVAYVMTWMIVAKQAPGFVKMAASIHFGGTVSWWSALLLVAINPIAEEFLYLGFVANVLRSRSYAAALWGSTLVRTAVHLYQGPLAFLAIAPSGVVLAWYYLESRRIWPAIVAHAVMDLYALRLYATWTA
jgi:membrane protease YdiL (CAAX protease family)